MATEITYSYPIPAVTDLQARLMLLGAPVTDWVVATAYTIETIHAGYLATFADVGGEEVEADAVQWVSVAEELAAEIALQGAVDLGDMPEQVARIDAKLQEVAPGEAPVIVLPVPSSPALSVLYLDVIDEEGPLDGVEVRATLQGDKPITIDGDYEGETLSKKASGHGETPGRVTFSTYPGLNYRITSTKLGLDKTVTAPAAGESADVYDLESVA